MKKLIGSTAIVLALVSISAPAQAQALSLINLFNGLLKISSIQGGGINASLLNGTVNVNAVSTGTQN